MTFTPILYGSKLNAPKRAAAPGGKPLVTGKGAAAAPGLAALVAQQALLTQRAEDSQGTGMTRLQARRQLAALNEQINAYGQPAAGARRVQGRQPFDEDKTRAGVQAMPTIANGAVASQPAVEQTPIVTTSSAEDEATKLKLAEEQRQRDIEKAKADELARQDEIRRRRGVGVNSFLTGGLRGIPTSLASILGV